MDKELLKYCKFYKGEERCPCDSGSFEQAFWIQEQQFFEQVYPYYPDKYKNYINSGDASKDFPELSDLFDGSAPMAVKSLFVHIGFNIDSMSPMGAHNVLVTISNKMKDKYK